MIYELRHYYIAAGRRSDWIRLMDEVVIPFQRKRGMFVIGSFFAVDQDDLYVWLRCYEDEAHKARVYDDVYGSDFWKNEIRPQIDEMLQRDRSQMAMLNPTKASLLR